MIIIPAVVAMALAVWHGRMRLAGTIYFGIVSYALFLLVLGG